MRWSILLPGFLALAALLTLAVPITSRADGAADTCSPVDLSGPRGPLHDMPIFDQPNGTCFAHAAVELAQGWLQSHPAIPPPPAPVPAAAGGSGYLPSPVVLAEGLGFETHKDLTGPSGAGASVVDAVDYLRRHGSCDQYAVFSDAAHALDSYRETRMHDELNGFFHSHNRWIQDNLPWLRQRSVDIMEQHRDWDLFHVNAQTFYEGALHSGVAQELCSTLVEMLGPGHLPQPLKVGNLTQVLAAMLVKDYSVDAFMTDYYSRVCRGHTAPANVPPVHTVDITSDKEAQDALRLIDARLEKPNAQPIGVNLCAGVFDSPDVRSRYYLPKSGELGCKDQTTHAVVVVGRKRNPDNGRCEYLIRNSWGTGCFKYVAAGTGHCNDRGEIYVDPKLLVPNIFGLNYLGD